MRPIYSIVIEVLYSFLAFRFAIYIIYLFTRQIRHQASTLRKYEYRRNSRNNSETSLPLSHNVLGESHHKLKK
jgi:hypothetical protein